jgi:hypothetical protein
MHDMDNETIILLSEGAHSEQQLEKIFALKALQENPGILGNAFTFEKLCYVLNDLKPNVIALEPPTILHIAKAVQFLEKQFPNHNWHPEIKQYIAAIAWEEGWVSLPGLLSFAQHELDMLHQNLDLDDDQKQLQTLKHEAVERYLKV